MSDLARADQEAGAAAEIEECREIVHESDRKQRRATISIRGGSKKDACFLPL
jgi:hypothetical protein